MDFSDYLTDIMNKSALSLMLSIGHRTGLFDVMGSLPPSTIKEISDKAKLNDRYVKEWIGGMVVGKIIEFN